MKSYQELWTLWEIVQGLSLTLQCNIDNKNYCGFHPKRKTGGEEGEGEPEQEGERS